MKEEENLLITVSEECAEIQQAVSKSLRFGLDNHHPTRMKSNAEEVLIEYYQLSAMIELLQENNTLPRFGTNNIAAIKREKVNTVKKYLGLSKDLGIVN